MAGLLFDALMPTRSAPRGFPYGVGDGFHLNEQRFLRILRGNELEFYRPARAQHPT